MKVRSFKPDVDLGLVGEIDVRRELAAEGWLAINSNTEKGNFPNVDLIAVKGQEARTIQVKTTDAEKGSHKHCLYMGRAEGWLTRQVSFFNAKPGPLRANIVVLVHGRRDGSRFVVLPVAVAEWVARSAVEQWFAIPKLDGGKRSAGFDARIPFTRQRKEASDLERLLQKVLLDHESRWDILDAPIEKLNDARVWGVAFARMRDTPLSVRAC